MEHKKSFEWTVELQEHWDFLDVGEFVEEPEIYKVIADDYESALAKAQEIALDPEIGEEIDGVFHIVTAVRLVSISRGAEVYI